MCIYFRGYKFVWKIYTREYLYPQKFIQAKINTIYTKANLQPRKCILTKHFTHVDEVCWRKRSYLRICVLINHVQHHHSNQNKKKSFFLKKIIRQNIFSTLYLIFFLKSTDSQKYSKGEYFLYQRNQCTMIVNEHFKK